MRPEPIFRSPSEAHAVGERFGRVVRQSREALGWSQEALAGRAALNRTYVGDIERGASIPSLLTAFKLAIALDTSLSLLVEQLERGAAA